MYSTIMTDVNVSATVRMSAPVGGNVRKSGGGGELSPTVGQFSNSGGNVCNSGEIKYVLGN